MATKFPLIPNKLTWFFSILHFHTKFGRKLIPGGEIANRFGPGNWVSGHSRVTISRDKDPQPPTSYECRYIQCCEKKPLVGLWLTSYWLKASIVVGKPGWWYITWHQLRNMIGSFWTQLWLIPWMFKNVLLLANQICRRPGFNLLRLVNFKVQYCVVRQLTWNLLYIRVLLIKIYQLTVCNRGNQYLTLWFLTRPTSWGGKQFSNWK